MRIVGPAPPRIETIKRDSSGKWTTTTTTTPTQAQYRDHLNRLNQILRDEQTMVLASPTAQQFNGKLKRDKENSTSIKMNSFEDLYKDFDSVYESLCHTATNSQNTPSDSIYGGSSTSGKQQTSDNLNSKMALSKGATFETEALAKSLIEVEEALKRVTTRSSVEVDDNSPTSSILAPEVEPQLTQIPSSQVSPIYGKPVLTSSKNQQQLNNHLTQPSLSPMLSTATSEQTRADSRNTNQSYQNGPALVEEMTLSDLEDEISLSLMDTKAENQSRQYFSDGEQLMLRTRRSRNPLPTSLSRHAVTNSTTTTNNNNNIDTFANRPRVNQAQQQPYLAGYHSTSRRYPRTAQGMYSRARQIHQ